MEIYLLGIGIALLIGFVISKSIKLILKLLINAIIGAIILFLANKILISFGITLNITPINAFLTGVFGIPFVIILLILKLFL